MEFLIFDLRFVIAGWEQPQVIAKIKNQKSEIRNQTYD
jgi:hypothetical protein